MTELQTSRSAVNPIAKSNEQPRNAASPGSWWFDANPVGVVVCAVVIVAVVWSMIGIRRLSAYREVLAFWQDALVYQPDDPRIQNNLGAALLNSGRPQDAVRYCELALRLMPNYPEADSNLGAAFLNMGRPQDAIPYCEAALQLRPEYPEAQFNLGTALLNTGRPQDAIEHFKEAVRLRPNHLDSYCNLGVSLFKAGQLPEALKYTEHYVRLKPGDAGAWINLAEVQARLNRKQDALAAARQALSLARRADGQTALAQRIERRVTTWSAGDVQPSESQVTPVVPQSISP